MSLIADDICSKKISTSNFHFLSNFLSKMLLFLISSPIVTCKKIAIGVMQLLAELKSLCGYKLTIGYVLEDSL